MNINAVTMVVATAFLMLLVFKWFREHRVTRRKPGKRHGYKAMAVYADGRCQLRWGGDPATDEWRKVKSPEALVVHLRREGWEVMDLWKPDWAKGAMVVAIREA